MIRRALVLASMLLLQPAAAAPAADPVRAALQDLQAADLRVASVGWRLITGNAARCQRRMPGTGLVLHTLGQYPPGAAREAALALQPALGELTVLGVVPGSPAALAGLATGDAITAIGGKPLSALPITGTHPTALRDASERELADLPVTGPVELTLQRGGNRQRIMLAPVPACRARIEVVAGAVLRARSDREIIQIGESFAAGLDDDGLATVIAHELAHTVLDHHSRLSGAESGLPRRARKALGRGFEDEADLLSLDLLAGAGWDPAVAPRFLRRHAGQLDRYPSGVHRKARDRAGRMERALAERNRHGG